MIGQAPPRGTLTILSDTDAILGLPPNTSQPMAAQISAYVGEWFAAHEPGKPLLLPFPLDIDDQRQDRRKVHDYAGHRIAEDHDCFLMNCSGLGAEVIALREMLAECADRDQRPAELPPADPALIGTTS